MTTGDDAQALKAHIFETVRDIVYERRTAVDAARDLDSLRSNLVLLSAALDPFVGQAARWDLYPEDRSEIETEIRSAAESLRRKLEA